MTAISQATDPVALRRVPVGSIARDIARIPADQIEAGWRVFIDGTWFHVEGRSVTGDGVVRLVITGTASPTGESAARVAGLATLSGGERVWARGPQPGAIETLGCIRADCAATGPYELTDEGLLCAEHLTALLSAIHDYVYEGDDDDDEH